MRPSALMIVFTLAGPSAFAQHPSPSPPDATTAATEAEDTHQSPSMQLLGFGDVSFVAPTADEEPSSPAFVLGQLDLFITSRLSERLSVLGEIVFEASDDNTVVADVERLLLRYARSESLIVSAGRYHTAIGYYNTAYHHGSWFETAVGRPFLFEFEDEGGVLPIHNVGLSVTGRIPSGGLGLHYVAEIGNGRASHSEHAEAVQIVNDENDRKAVNLALLLRPDSVSGLQVGVSGYFDRLEPREAPTPSISQTILAVHAVFQNSKVEWLSEALVLRHAPRGRATTNTPGFYAQAARKIGRWRPYLRYQYVSAPAGDLVISQLGRQHGPSLGVRYDLGDFAALKAQYDRLNVRGRDARDTFTVQAAFTF
jgi:hypothetical protein